MERDSESRALIGREEASSRLASSQPQESASSSLPEYGVATRSRAAKTTRRSIDCTSRDTQGSEITADGRTVNARRGAAPKTSPPTPSPRNNTVVNLRAGTRQGLPMLAAGTSKVSPSQAGAAPHCSNVAGFTSIVSSARPLRLGLTLR